MSPDRGRQLWLVPVLLLTVIATAVGGLLARDLYAEPAPTRPRVVVTSAPSVAPEEQPGPGEVRGTPDAVAHPVFEPVRVMLQAYFDAINNHDYRAWTATVTADRVEVQPEKAWNDSYDTVRDGNIVLHRIEMTGPDEGRLLLTFTSTQDTSDAPPELRVECIEWAIVYPVVREESGWKISTGLTSASPQHHECGT